LTAAAANDESTIQRAEELVDRVQDQAEQVGRLALARAMEFAQDVWAEAQSLRDSRNASGS
jgi:hypothetical protein